MNTREQIGPLVEAYRTEKAQLREELAKTVSREVLDRMTLQGLRHIKRQFEEQRLGIR